MRRIRAQRGWLLLCISLMALHAAAADANSVSGQVLDPQGKVIPGAIVQLLSEDRLGVNQAKTDAEGKFQFPPVPPGDYRLTVDAPGFNTITRSIAVRTGEPVSETLQFSELRSQNQSILITAKVLEPSRRSAECGGLRPHPVHARRPGVQATERRNQCGSARRRREVARDPALRIQPGSWRGQRRPQESWWMTSSRTRGRRDTDRATWER